MFITVQRIRVFSAFSFQSNFSFGAVHSADEKHLSADTDDVGIVKYLIRNFCKGKSCAAVSV